MDEYLLCDNVVVIFSFGREYQKKNIPSKLHTYKARADEQCTICLDDVIAGSSIVAKIECTHVFHYDCLQTWVNSASTCPQCRGVIRV
jgi:hypothetical protein